MNKGAKPMIEIQHISKNFRQTEVLHDISFNIQDGELITIIGESGCGKTTLIKLINRLIKPTSGTILIDGEDIENVNEVALRRKIGYVIQQTGLFPHMTVGENISLIPSIAKKGTPGGTPEALEKKTIELLEMVNMDPASCINRYPTELSGGQQQRIGVARAFANDPEIILMDEPFSAVDPITRAELQEELIDLHNKVSQTIVFVTHDMDEAIKIADKICIMKDGYVLQYDTPENILRNPADRYVSDFVGRKRIWSSPEFIKVQDIMIENPICAKSNTTVFRALGLMREKRIDSLLITEAKGGCLIGAVKAETLREVSDSGSPITPYIEFPKNVLYPDQNILDALNIANNRKESTIPVIDREQHLLGLITKSSLVTVMSQQYFEVEDDKEVLL